MTPETAKLLRRAGRLAWRHKRTIAVLIVFAAALYRSGGNPAVAAQQALDIMAALAGLLGG